MGQIGIGVIIVSLPDGKPIDLSAPEACWLVRALVEESNRAGAAVTYKAAYDDACKKLGLGVIAESASRLEKFISRPPRTFKPAEAEAMKSALEQVFFKERQPDNIRRLAEEISAGYAVRTPNPHITVKWRHLLDLHKGTQESVAHLIGDYIILRYAEDKFYASFMTVRPGTEIGGPLEFSTIATPLLCGGPYERVHGRMWGVDAGFVFSVGKLANKSEVRSGIFQVLRKPGEQTSQKPIWDLAGLRLGLGRSVRDPSAYRIWCSRQDNPATAQSNLVGKYDPQSLVDNFSKYVSGLTEIMTWIRELEPLGLGTTPAEAIRQRPAPDIT